MATNADWQKVLGHLKQQTPQATFDNLLRGTRLLSVEDSRWRVGVPNEYAIDWLEHRLNGLVNRTAEFVWGRPVVVEFVVDLPGAGRVVDEAPGETGPTEVELASLVRRLGVEGRTRLAVDIRQMNRAGYQPLPDYYARFISAYLYGKWGRAGLLAYSLWEQEVAIDRQAVKTKQFSNWTKPRRTTLTELAGRLGVSRHTLTGKYIYCWKAQQARQGGHPLGECCGLRGAGAREFLGGRCRYWQEGILEILSREGVLAVEEQGRLKHHQLTVQFWRSWPLLTPRQVARYFTPAKQEEHRGWLEAYGKRLGLTVEQWLAETAQETAEIIEQYPDREEGRECGQGFQRNPFR